MVQTPASIAWLPSSTTGSLTFQYLNPTTNSGPLAAGALSGTSSSSRPSRSLSSMLAFKILSRKRSYPKAYSPTAGTISPVPAPEPATVLAWAGVLAGVAIGRRFRRRQQTA